MTSGHLSKKDFFCHYCRHFKPKSERPTIGKRICKACFDKGVWSRKTKVYKKQEKAYNKPQILVPGRDIGEIKV